MRFILLSFLFFALNVVAQNKENLPNDYELVQLESASLYAIVKNPNKANFTIDIAGHQLYLTPSNILDADYKIVNEKGERINDKGSRAIPLRGVSSKGEQVSITIAPGFIYGSIGLGNDELLIEPARFYLSEEKAPDSYILYNSSNLDMGDITCGTKTLHHFGKQIQDQNLERSMVDLCYEVEYAICHDFGMVSQLGSTTAVENFGIANTNELNTLYDDEFADEVRFIVSGQYVSTCASCDPWSSSTNISNVLPSFRTWGQNSLDAPPINIPHDNATLWSARDFDGGTVGLAYVGVICTASKYNVCENLESLVSNRRLVGHEIGHNFNAQHVSGTFLMAPSLGSASDNWNNLSITSVQNHYNSRTCLSNCTPNQIRVNWAELTTDLDEVGGTGSTGNCNTPFIDYSIPITINGNPTSTVTVDITVDQNASTASSDDYQLLTTQVTFTSSGNLTENVNLRILDDVVQEMNESLVLNIAINSGPATPGAASTTTITIIDNGDDVASAGNVSYTYNTGTSNLFAPFAGGNSQSRTRVLLPASLLTSLGLSAGNLNQLDLNILQKNSSNPYNNFRIGLANHPGTSFPNTFISTSTVFEQDISTVVDWNNFVFDTPFFWDGTSSLYLDICYNSSNPGDFDFIRANSSAGGSMQFVTSFYFSSGQTICNGNVTAVNAYNRTPWFRLYQEAGAVIATNTTPSPVNGILKTGETGHFFNDNDEIILSLTNTGNVDIGCADVSIVASGNGRSNFSFSNDRYTDKIFEVNAPNQASYDITLYYTPAELAIWGSSNESLNMVKSSALLQNAQSNDLTVVAPDTVFNNVGLSNGIAYRGSFTGFSYFALTDALPSPDITPVDTDGELVLFSPQSGIVFTSPNGSHFLLQELIAGTLVTTPINSTDFKVKLENSDFYINSNQQSFIVRPNNGGTYSQYTINNGALVRTPVNTLPQPNIRLENGNFLLAEPGAGLIIKDNNGQCQKITVGDLGLISIIPVTCP